MKPSKIKGVRAGFGYTQKYMAEQLGIEPDSYSKKERGLIRFTLPEKQKLIEILQLTPEQINELLCDGLVPLNR